MPTKTQNPSTGTLYILRTPCMPNVIVATPSNPTPTLNSANQASPTQMKNRAQPAASNLLLVSCRPISLLLLPKSGRPSGPQYQFRIVDMSRLLIRRSHYPGSDQTHSVLCRLHRMAGPLMRVNAYRVIELDVQRKRKFKFRVGDSNQLHTENGVAICAL